MRPVPVGSRHLVGLIGADLGPSLSPPLHEREADAPRPALRLPAHRPRRRSGSRRSGVGDLVRTARRPRLRRAEHHPPVQADGRHAPRRALARRGRARRGQHGRVPRRPRDRPQHRLVRLPRGFVAGPARRRPVATSCCSARAAPARPSRTPLLGLGVGRIVIVDAPARARPSALAAALRDRYGGRPRPRGARRRPRARAARGGRPGQRHPGRHGRRIPGCRSRRTCCAPTCGWPTSSTARSRPSCCAQARERGCRTLDGGGMVVFQAAAAFALFTGRRARRRADAPPLRDAHRAHRQPRSRPAPERGCMRKGIATVSPQRHASRRSSPRPPRSGSTGSSCSRTTSSAARSRRTRSAVRAAELGLRIDLYQPFRDFEAVAAEPARAQPAPRRGEVRRHGARSASTRSWSAPTSRPTPIDDDALAAEQLAPAGRAGRRPRAADRLRGAGLGPARQRVRPRLADRRGGRPPRARASAWTASTSCPAATTRPASATSPAEKIFFVQLADAPHLRHGRAAVEPALPLLPRPGRLRPHRASWRTSSPPATTGRCRSRSSTTSSARPTPTGRPSTRCARS